MTDDDARARALKENRRRSEVMAKAQRFGPPSPQTPSADDPPAGANYPPPVVEPFDLDGPVLSEERAFEVVPSKAGGWAAVSAALARLLATASTEGLWWATINQPDGTNPAFAHLGPDEGGALYTEVAGDFYLPVDARLNDGQRAKLRDLGWADPVHDLSGGDEVQPRNHTRSWPVDQVANACDHVLMTLQVVYGFAETDGIGVCVDPFA